MRGGQSTITLTLSICFFIMLYVVYQGGEGNLLTVNSTEFSLGVGSGSTIRHDRQGERLYLTCATTLMPDWIVYL